MAKNKEEEHTPGQRGKQITLFVFFQVAINLF